MVMTTVLNVRMVAAVEMCEMVHTSRSTRDQLMRLDLLVTLCHDVFHSTTVNIEGDGDCLGTIGN